MNIAYFIIRHGLAKVMMATITYPAGTSDAECERIFNSVATGVIRRRYGEGIVVRERQRNGTRHHHVFLPVVEDEVLIPGREKRSMEYKYWRGVQSRYQIGNTRISAVTSIRDAQTYLTKDLAGRDERDKGKRLVTYLESVKSRRVSPRFSWATGKARRFRRNAAAFAAMLVENGAIDKPTSAAVTDYLRDQYGSRFFAELVDRVQEYAISRGEPDDRPLTYEQLRAMSAAARQSARNPRQNDLRRDVRP